MLYPIETTKINNTEKSYSPLEKDNEPETDFFFLQILMIFVLIKLFSKMTTLTLLTRT